MSLSPFIYTKIERFVMKKFLNKKVAIAFVAIFGVLSIAFALNVVQSSPKDSFGRNLLPSDLSIEEFSELQKLQNKEISEKELEKIQAKLEKHYDEVLSKTLTNDEIVYFYQDILKDTAPNATIRVKKRERVLETDYEKVIMEIDVLGQKIDDLVFVNGPYLLPDIIDVPTKKSLKEGDLAQLNKAKSQVFEERALEALKDEKRLVSLGKKGVNGQEIFVFSDPECPYCRRHLESVDEKFIENNRIHFVFTTVHGKSAFEKVALIWKETQNKRSDKDKLKIIKKYYENGVNYKTPSDKEVKEAEKLLAKYTNLGLKGVPFIIEVK